MNMAIYYAEAAELVQWESMLEKKEIEKEQSTEKLVTNRQMGDGNIWLLNKGNFVYFMAGVINHTFQASGRLEGMAFQEGLSKQEQLIKKIMVTGFK